MNFRTLSPTRLAFAAVLASFAVVGSACAEGEADSGLTAGPSTSTNSTDPNGDDDDDTKIGGGKDSGATKAKDAGGSSNDDDAGDGPSTKPDASVDAGPGTGTCTKVAPSNTCGLTPQCGCAANETCDVTNGTTGAVSCVLAGGGSQGSYCTATTQCAKGLTCGYHSCRPYCETAGSACTGTGVGECQQYYDTTGTAVVNSKVCSIACNLLDSTSCGAGNCIWDETIDQPDCDQAGTGTLYDSCSAYNQCGHGLGCAYNDYWEIFECETWCRIGKNDCSTFEDCVDVYGAAAPTEGGYKLGHCQ